MSFNFAQAIKSVVEAVKNVLHQMVEAFADFVKSLTEGTVYYEYVHSSIETARNKGNAIINRGGVAQMGHVEVVNPVRSVQSKELCSPTFDYQS